MAEYPLQSHTNMQFKENEGDRSCSQFLEEGILRSPNLGLTLRKSPSFIKLIETKLAKAGQQKRRNDFISKSKAEKNKAANFTASALIIGSWQRISKNQGDLMAKLYYAKRKLVWEALEVGLKTKIEIQWSNISAIRVHFLNDCAKMEIELNQPPSFSRETNPQPRKHTIWKAASDFTGGQATICRKHTVYFPRGSLDKHYEKLLLCDRRLFDLSKKPFPSQEYPYFHQNVQPNYQVQNVQPNYQVQNVQPNYQVQNVHATPTLPAHLSNFKQYTHSHFTTMNPFSPMSGMDLQALDEGGNYQWCNQGQGVNNHIQGNHTQGVDSIAMTTIQGNGIQNCYLNNGEDLSAGMNDPNSAVFDDFENQLLEDSLNTYEEMAFLTRFESMHPPLDLQQAEANNITYNPQTNYWLPPQQVYSNNTMNVTSSMNMPPYSTSTMNMPQYSTSSMNMPPYSTSTMNMPQYSTSSMNMPPHSYVGPAEPTMEDFAALAGRQNKHHWN